MSSEKSNMPNLSESSKRTYSNSMTKLIIYLYTNKQHLITKEYKAILKGKNEQEQQRFVKQSIFNKNTKEFKTPPIDFDNLKADDFADWIKTLTRPNGEYYTYSTYSDHKSALTHLHTVNDRVMNSDLEKKISEFYSTFLRENCSVNNAKKSESNYSKTSSTTPTKRKSIQDTTIHTCSLQSPLLTKRIKFTAPKKTASEIKQEKKTKAVKVFLSKVHDHLDVERYETFGKYLSQYHGTMSSQATVDRSILEDTTKKLKSQVFTLFQENKELFAAFEKFL